MRRITGFSTVPRLLLARQIVFLTTDGLSPPHDEASATHGADRRVSVFTAPPLFDMAQGSDYYFPPDRTHSSPSSSGSSATPRPTPSTATVGKGQPATAKPLACTSAASRSRAEVPVTQTSAKSTVVYVRSAFRQMSLDTSRPPVTPEEVLHWQLDRHLYGDPQAVHFFPNTTEPLFLLPPHAMVTSLGPEMDAVDRLYRQKGLFTPSEIAEVFFSVIPTFYVESSHAFKALPSNIVFRLDSLLPRGVWVAVLLGRYPMLFDLRRPKFQKSMVKLNSSSWFVREHPLYGSADRLLRAHNVEFRASGGGVLHKHVPTGAPSSPGGRQGHQMPGDSAALSADALKEDAGSTGMDKGCVPHATTSHESVPDPYKPIELRIFDILVRHLPRYPSPSPAVAPGKRTEVPESVKKMRYQPVPLVEWVNSFTQAELDVLNQVSQERVLALMQRYTHVFQLLTHATPATTSSAAVNGLIMRPGGPRRFAEVLPSHNFFVEHAELSAVPVSSGTENAPTTTTPLPSEETNGGTGTATVATTSESDLPAPSEALMKEALQEDIVGLDDLIAAHVQEATHGEADTSKNHGTGARQMELEDKADDDPQEVSGGTPPLHEDDGDVDFDNLIFETDGREEPTLGTSTLKGMSSVPLNTTSPCVDAGEANEMDHAGSSLILESLLVRRLPPEVAPRSLSNFNEGNSPCPALVRFCASFLNPPPSLSDTSTATPLRGNARGTSSAAGPTAHHLFTGDGPSREPRVENTPQTPCQPSAARLWRWVPVQRLYKALSLEQQRFVRRQFRGLVTFLRLHGEVFELNADFTHVIAHDPRGTVAPLVPSQTHFSFEERVVLPTSFDDDDTAPAALIGEESRRLFTSVMGASQLPTTRHQLVLLDPNNPLLHHQVLEEELAELVPENAAVERTQLMRKLPPLLRAVLPIHFSLANNRLLVCWNENGVAMVQRRERGLPAVLEAPLLTPEEAVEALREAVPVGGATVRALTRMHVPAQAVRALEEHFGSVFNAATAFPHYFRVTESRSGGRPDAMIELIAS